jgi:hypothetical protein
MPRVEKKNLHEIHLEEEVTFMDDKDMIGIHGMKLVEIPSGTGLSILRY